METGRILVGVPRETFPGESRVALVPAALPVLAKAGMDVIVEHGAGEAAGFRDASYEKNGGRLGARVDVFEAEIVVQVRTCGANPDAGRDDIERYHPDQIIAGMADPLVCPIGIQQAAERKVIAFALDFMPRITRAQVMDVLSSQATAVGYKAVLLAAERLPKLFPMLTTAAGTVPPAQVFVIGAGVAGLQAIATARRLGAVVQGYDVRPAAQEDIESLGGRAVLLPLQPGDAEDKSGYAKELGEAFYRRQQEFMAQVVAGSDVVISTALIPGKKAPVLITEEAVARMQPGSVIVDCAAERGGNCALTRPNRRVVTDNRVTILGPTNLASSVPTVASQMYSKNVTAFLTHVFKDGSLDIDFEDEIVKGTLVTRAGDIVHTRVLESLAEVGHDGSA
ncbi:MAG TPA: NAD(P) transhydrogenase subunit alpha [Actinomycetota bacterium]|jgi:NAD(P) transhydrogenase subunit alpha|nr:NAD(P) transhydrogenase subunit alpha [Actinomycetota bacterium]